MEKRTTEPYLSAYLHQKGYKMGFPVSGTFELTARCNFNCPMCYVHMSSDEVAKKGKELTASQWIKMAEDAKNKGVVFLLLTGGEPFIRKDFFEIYDAIKAMGIMVSINTNGSLLEGDILKRLLDNPPYRMNISLYGGCNETYQNICGLAMYDKVMNNIIALKEHGVDVRLNLSITPYNCEDIKRIHEISEKYDIHVKASSYMYPPIRLDKDLEGYGNRLSPEDSAKWNVVWDKLRLSDEEFKLRADAMKKFISIDKDECSMDMDEGVGCRAGSTSFWFTWDGQMRPCGMMPGPTAYPLETGFDAAWDTIVSETKKIKLPAKCSNCAKKEVCGVCAAVCVSETGKFDGVPEYMCKRTDEIIKKTCDYVI